MAERQSPQHGHRTTQSRAGAKRANTRHVRASSKAFRPGRADPDWSPRAVQLWKSVLDSGQVELMEPSDWVTLRIVCDELTAYQAAPRRNAQLLASIRQMMASLMLTESDRRSSGVEIDRTEEEDDSESAGVLLMQRFAEERSRRRSS